jgi:hypothetical protein
MSRLQLASNEASPATGLALAAALTRKCGLWAKLTKHRGDEMIISGYAARPTNQETSSTNNNTFQRERLTPTFSYWAPLLTLTSLLFPNCFSALVPLLLLSAFARPSSFLFRHEYTKRLLVLPCLILRCPSSLATSFLSKKSALLSRNDPVTRYE